MTDILLFNPAPRSGWQAHRRVELPLSLLSPGTPLDRLGYRVTIVDQFANPDWEREFRAAMVRKPICLGVTCMTGPQILHALDACKMFKARHPDVPIVWGGVHASLLPKQTLESPYVDIVVVGEGEATFEELVKALQARRPLDSVAGIWYKADSADSTTERRRILNLSPLASTSPTLLKQDGGSLSTGERPFVDLDLQPPLSYHLVDMNLYRRSLFGVDHISFNSSRGCTFRCAFCWDPVMHKRRWRAMSPETVLEHMKRIVRDYGIRGFLFTDDHFFIDMKRAHGILEKIVQANLDITISKLQIRADTICQMDKEFLELMVRAGAKRLTVGVESGSQRILDLIKKDVLVEEVLEANRRLVPYPIVPLYLFMMGLPSETPVEFEQSIRLAERLLVENPRAVKTFNIYTPYPGTELYDVAVQNGLKEPRRLEDWALFNFRNIAEESPWIVPETKKLIEGLDLPLMFLGESHFVKPSYRKTSRFVSSLGRMYSPLARYRVKHLDARFPIETRVVKALGLFGRQD